MKKLVLLVSLAFAVPVAVWAAQSTELGQQAIQSTSASLAGVHARVHRALACDRLQQCDEELVGKLREFKSAMLYAGELGAAIQQLESQRIELQEQARLERDQLMTLAERVAAINHQIVN